MDQGVSQLVKIVITVLVGIALVAIVNLLIKADGSGTIGTAIQTWVGKIAGIE